MLLIRPDIAQRLTVFGSTRNTVATSLGVSKRSRDSATTNLRGIALPRCGRRRCGPYFDVSQTLAVAATRALDIPVGASAPVQHLPRESGKAGFREGSVMQPDWDASSVLAVAVVTAMTDRFAGTDERQCVVRIGQMLTDSKIETDVLGDWCIGALGLLATRALEDLATSSGEPIALWLERWLDETYGAPLR
jgi:hypothetical protein